MWCLPPKALCHPRPPAGVGGNRRPLGGGGGLDMGGGGNDSLAKYVRVLVTNSRPPPVSEHSGLGRPNATVGLKSKRCSEVFVAPPGPVSRAGACVPLAHAVQAKTLKVGYAVSKKKKVKFFDGFTQYLRWTP